MNAVFSSRNPSPPRELERLDAHFGAVLGVLERRPPPRLSATQARARARNVELLARYRARARFPKNRRFPGRYLPHFIDEEGTRCALGQLIELGGARDLVQHIASTRNYQRVRELQDLPELAAWLEANGLTLDEAARIQPEYCGPPAQNCLCGNLASGYVEGTLGDSGTTLTVTAVYGPVKGVSVGDALAATDANSAGTGHDIVFASLGGDGKSAFVVFGATNGDVSIPTSACWFPQVASIPGTLPLSLVEQALSSADVAACQRVITQYDARWGVDQGGCTRPDAGSPGAGGSPPGTQADGGTNVTPGPTKSSDGGCGIALHGGGGAAMAVVVSAACILHRARRRGRLTR